MESQRRKGAPGPNVIHKHAVTLIIKTSSQFRRNILKYPATEQDKPLGLFLFQREHGKVKSDCLLASQHCNTHGVIYMLINQLIKEIQVIAYELICDRPDNITWLENVLRWRRRNDSLNLDYFCGARKPPLIDLSMVIRNAEVFYRIIEIDVPEFDSKIPPLGEFPILDCSERVFDIFDR